jgi:2-dehydro-3-deoxyphosphogluconate aldolase/(4S)-4-hydroxy-2-oxoglutarate aldolase
MDHSRAVLELIGSTPMIPVLTIDEVESAVDLARALTAGGLRLLEITLRTAGALDAIQRIATAVPDAIVGAGTVLDGAQYATAVAAGARFVVSPGATPALLDAAEAAGAPLLPGCATASEAMALFARGYHMAKFVPAEPAGGIPYLKSLAEPLRHLRFCPTGGIDLAKARDYLALPNVVCVGGSWVAPRRHLEAGNWAAITTLAREAADLRSQEVSA